jgi:putative hemolysin
MEVRQDVRVVANDLLLRLPGLSEHFLPYDVFAPRPQKENLAGIERALQQEEAVLFFPSAEVARLTWRGIREPGWHNGPVHFARKHSAAVLPVFVHGRNSPLFYAVSLVSRPLSTLLLPGELFNKRGRTLALRVGDLIPASAFTQGSLGTKTLTRLLERHVARVGRGKRGPFKTESCIVHPVDRERLRSELATAQRLGATPDGKRVLLADGDRSTLLREIARLRECAFRKVGEGTGGRMDLDAYDRHYRHIVLWDEPRADVVGAYRIGECSTILAERGREGLYSASLFQYSQELDALLPKSIELGRSFVQPKYWNSRALDYLWQGIGAYLASRPDLEHMFGCVSISNTYPEPAKDLLVHFFSTWFGGGEVRVLPRRPYLLSRAREEEIRGLLPGTSYREELRALKETLKQYGCAIPTLYKQYADLCEPGGVQFLGFGVDPDFGSCVDGFILVSVGKITAEKRQRYIEPAEVAAHRGLQAAS